MRFYASYNGKFVPMLRDNLSAPSSVVKQFKKNGVLTLEDGADRLSRNVGTESPIYAAYNPRRTQITLT